MVNYKGLYLFIALFLFLTLYKLNIFRMKYPTHINMQNLGDGNYKVTDDKENRYFIGELDEALDFYSAWSLGKEPYDDIEYIVDIEGLEFECDFDLDIEEDED